MYVRLLTSNPQLARTVVLSERPTISDNSFACQPRILDRLISNISTLASVYHQLPETFILRNRNESVARDDAENTEDEEETEEKVNAVRQEMRQRVRGAASYVEDDADESDSEEDGSSSDDGAAQPPPPLRQMSVALSESQRGQNERGGLRVAATLKRGPKGSIGLQLMVGNFTPHPIGQFDISINKNSFGLGPAGPLSLPESIAPNGTGNAVLLLTANQAQFLSGQPPSHPLFLQVALKCSLDVFFFNVGHDLSAVLTDNGPVPQDSFRETWTQVPAERKMRYVGQMAAKVSAQDVIARCRQYYLYLVAQREGEDADVMYFCMRTCNGVQVFCEVSLQRSGPGLQLVACSPAPQVVAAFQAFVGELLRVRWSTS